MESHALIQERLAARRGPVPLLRLAGDDRLVALTRAGNQAAFEVIVARYQARLLSFCTRIVGSREDAEDVLQEVFTASFNALLADDREINLRPWLYRIARNRSLNHLRRHSAIGVDSMDVHFAEMGISTSDKVFKREDFKLLVEDIGLLPESQRTALLLREIDGMHYEQIAIAMDTTVPGVKSLLVRARIGLGEATEARKLSCADVRHELGEAAEGLGSLTQPARRHLKTCASCSEFRSHLRANKRTLAALAPFAPLLLLKQLFATKLTAGGASAGGSAAAASGGGAAAAGGSVAIGGGSAGAFTATALATKAVATLAAVGIVAVVAVGHTHAPAVHHPAVVAQVPVAPAVTVPPRTFAVHHARRHHAHKLPATVQTTSAALTGATTLPAATVAPAPAPATTPSSEEVTTTTAFPGGTTGASGATSTTGATSATTTTVSGSTAPTTTSTGASGATTSTGASGATTNTGASATTGSGATGSTGSGATGSTGTTGP